MKRFGIARDWATIAKCTCPNTAVSRRTRLFARDDEGSLIIFGLILFVLMAMMGGIAVDVMRFEERRTELQQTLDRSVLAAASLTQDLDPEDVVRDYFAKAGMTQYLDGVDVDYDTLNYKKIRARAKASVTPFFMHMIGIDNFDAKAGSGAEQRITNVEIALVLDISGSMSGGKINNLKTAAKEFVDTVLDADANNRTSITIVPYNAQVNLGETLRSKYNATYEHGTAGVNCLEIPDSVYGNLTMSRTAQMPMSAYADTDGGTSKNDSYTSYSNSSYGKFNATAANCRPNEGNEITLPTNDKTLLKQHIDSLTARGNTSIMLGMKWGVTLIDPGFRPVFNQLVGSNDIPNVFPGRPFNYSDPESMKIVVLMTDGEHVVHNYVKDAFKTGMSPIYRSRSDNEYSIYHSTQSGSKKYYVPSEGKWQSSPWKNGVQQTWQQVWASQRVSWVAWQLYARALGTSNSNRTSVYNSTYGAMRGGFESVNDMNKHLQQSCTMAKAQGVTVYGIAFAAPTTGQVQIEGCSTSSAHFFNVEDLDIGAAFRTIAGNITQLRLTQ